MARIIPDPTVPHSQQNRHVAGGESACAHGVRPTQGTVWGGYILVCLLYLLLALALTWPTVARLTTHLPGDGGDDPAIAWNLWWVKHAVLDLGTNPLASDTMFHPLGVNLAFYTLTVLNALTALPLTLNLGVVTASNLHMLFSLVLAAYGAYLLARQELAKSTRNVPTIPAAILAGIFYSFAGSRLFYISLGQFNIASIHWIPFCVLFLLRTCRQPERLRWPVLAAVFLVLQAWAEMTYASFVVVFGVLLVVCCGAGRLMTAGRAGGDVSAPMPRWWTDLGRDLVLLGLLFVLGIAPLLGAMLPDMMAEGDFWVEGTGFAEAFSADILGFLVPTMRHPWLGSLVARTGIPAFDKGQHIFAGITLSALAAVGVFFGVRHGKWRKPGPTIFWLVSASFFGWLCLGTSAHLNGVDTGIPGPFLILQRLPFFKGNRYPSRFGTFLVLSLAILAAMGVAVLLRRLARGGNRARRLVTAAAVLLGSCFVAEHLATPLPMSNMAVPEAYVTLAAPRIQGTLLDIPFAWRNGFRVTGPIHPGFMFGQFYQTVHQRPMLQGNTSRNPEALFQYFTRAPILNSLLALETGHELPAGREAQDKTIAGDVLRFLDVTTIVIRSGETVSVPPAVVPEAARPYVEEVLPVRKMVDQSGIIAYAVDLPPFPSNVTVAADSALIDLYLAEGWGPIPDVQGTCLPATADNKPAAPGLAPGGESFLWAQRQTVRLLIDTAGEAGNLSWEAFAPDTTQVVTVRTHGWSSGPQALSPGWQNYALPLPAGALSLGTDSIYFDFATLYPVRQFLNGMGEACPHVVVATSAGQEVGDFGRVFLNGELVAPGDRGYNLTAVCPDAGATAGTYDTHLDPAASSRMVDFLERLPSGCMIAAAVADEASMNLSEAAVNALRGIGAGVDLRGRFRWSHALIGVTGAGVSLEAASEIAPVTVAVGPAVTQPQVAAAFRWIRYHTD